MSASALPVSLSEISRKRMSATDSIGTMTMTTKKSRRRARKLIDLACLHYVPTCGAIAQLGERLDRTQEVGGSSPPSSIPETPAVEPRMACRTLRGARLETQLSPATTVAGDPTAEPTARC